MNPMLKKRVLSACGAFLLALPVGKVAFADDSEIFLGNSNNGVAPNILFILDTSGSMTSSVYMQTPYDPKVKYDGNCDSSKVYYQTGTTVPKGCGSLSSMVATQLVCKSSQTALGAGGPGFYTDRFVQWRQNSSSNYFWTNAVSSTSGRYEVACNADFPDSKPFPTTYNGSNNTTANQWVDDPNAKTSYWKSGGSGATYTFYNANYLNYQASNPPVVIGTRSSVMKQAATDLVNSIANANIGLMRYSWNGGSGDSSAAGGMVAYPVSPIASNRAGLVDTIKNFTAEGNTPLSETLFEAYRYYSGGDVYFGNSSQPYASVAASRVGGATGKSYKSPIQYQCQKNFIVYLTDGLPTQDNQADSLISQLGGSCDDTSKSPYNGRDAKGNAIPGGWGPGAGAGKCMSALAKYMYSADLSSSLPGQQNVRLYTIGFGDDPSLAAASTWLQSAAKSGDGAFYTASDLDDLQSVFSKIVDEIKKTSVTFTAPTVSVNAFNRTQTLDDLYVSVFQPSVKYHWPGNVKKYRFQNGEIVDATGAVAVDAATGSFKASAQSFWSSAPDGANVTAGGAASQIPSWNPGTTPTRKLYTYLGTNTPTSRPAIIAEGNRLDTANDAITKALLGVATDAGRIAAINYARGEDLRDEVQGPGSTGVIDEPRKAMGDPIHSQPAVVIYGGTASSANVNDAVIYAATNDGFLHAFDVVTGKELWAYIPQEMLPELAQTYSNEPTSPKNYALDGSIRALKFDMNNDGVVDPSAGDAVVLYFGTGRGGSNYYAVDVTYKDNPKFMWSIGPSTPGLSGIGQTWSTPVVTRVNISGAAQNSNKLVLVFGGGYDSAEENTTYNATNATGNAIYMVDAVKGNVVWSASKTGASLNLEYMTHAIPSDMAVMDFDGDGYADRMYVGDMGGQLWRFDVVNGNPATTVVAGGVIASLGTRDDSTHTVEATRRFYNAPDVAAIERRGMASFFNIAIGSGYRGHPLDTQVQDRFYSIRDYLMFQKLTQEQYDKPDRRVIKDSDTDLTDITDSITTVVPAGAAGWKLQLRDPGAKWLGEKSLSKATTFNNQVLFTTYTPNTSASSDPCAPGLGSNRIYAVSALDGSPSEGTQRYALLSQGGIAPAVTILFPDLNKDPTDPTDPTGPGEPGPGGPGGPGSPGGGGGRRVECTSGVEVLGVCGNSTPRIKTHWSEKNAN